MNNVAAPVALPNNALPTIHPHNFKLATPRPLVVSFEPMCVRGSSARQRVMVTASSLIEIANILNGLNLSWSGDVIVRDPTGPIEASRIPTAQAYDADLVARAKAAGLYDLQMRESCTIGGRKVTRSGTAWYSVAGHETAMRAEHVIQHIDATARI